MKDSGFDFDRMAAVRKSAAEVFGLPVERIRFYEEMCDVEMRWVRFVFDSIEPEAYIYAMTSMRSLLPRRERLRAEWSYKFETASADAGGR